MIPLALVILMQITPLPETVGWTYYPAPISALENPSPPLVIITPGLPLYIPAPWCAGCPVIVYSPRALTLDDLRVGEERPGDGLVDARLFEWTDADKCIHQTVHFKSPFIAYNYAVRTCEVRR